MNHDDVFPQSLVIVFVRYFFCSAWPKSSEDIIEFFASQIINLFVAIVPSLHSNWC